MKYGLILLLAASCAWAQIGGEFYGLNAKLPPAQHMIIATVEGGENWRVVEALDRVPYFYDDMASGFRKVAWTDSVKTTLLQVKTEFAGLPKRIREKFGLDAWRTVATIARDK